MTRRVLTGIKPTGVLHLGNFFGMVQQILELQRDPNVESLVFLADYHALTTCQDPMLLRKNTLEMARTLLALGVDPERTTLFRQSVVPQVHELAWILSTVTGMGSLFRCHAYKAAEAKGEEGVMNHGTFSYPVLMAADILLYGTHEVPVGQDQHQHVQVAQDMATHLEGAYGPGLVVRPKARLYTGQEVPGYDGRKMSKSYGNILSPLATEDEARAFVRRIKTDSTPLEDPKDPSACVVARLHRLVATPEEADTMDAAYRAGGYGYGHAKQALVAAVRTRFAEARERYYALTDDDVSGVLFEGGMKAQALATVILARVRTRVGLLPL